MEHGKRNHSKQSRIKPNLYKGYIIAYKHSKSNWETIESVSAFCDFMTTPNGIIDYVSFSPTDIDTVSKTTDGMFSKIKQMIDHREPSDITKYNFDACRDWNIFGNKGSKDILRVIEDAEKDYYSDERCTAVLKIERLLSDNSSLTKRKYAYLKSLYKSLKREIT